eukprot:5170829-Amphidinium_carterae.1
MQRSLQVAEWKEKLKIQKIFTQTDEEKYDWRKVESCSRKSKTLLEEGEVMLGGQLKNLVKLAEGCKALHLGSDPKKKDKSLLTFTESELTEILDQLEGEQIELPLHVMKALLARKAKLLSDQHEYEPLVATLWPFGKEAWDKYSPKVCAMDAPIEVKAKTFEMNCLEKVLVELLKKGEIQVKAVKALSDALLARCNVDPVDASDAEMMVVRELKKVVETISALMDPELLLHCQDSQSVWSGQLVACFAQESVVAMSSMVGKFSTGVVGKLAVALDGTPFWSERFKLYLHDVQEFSEVLPQFDAHMAYLSSLEEVSSKDVVELKGVMDSLQKYKQLREPTWQRMCKEVQRVLEMLVSWAEKQETSLMDTNAVISMVQEASIDLGEAAAWLQEAQANLGNSLQGKAMGRSQKTLKQGVESVLG